MILTDQKASLNEPKTKCQAFLQKITNVIKKKKNQAAFHYFIDVLIKTILK